jgi:Major Facilitator Superfamily
LPNNDLPLAQSEQTSPRSKRQAWLVASLLFVVALINYFDRQSLSVVAPRFQQELHLSDQGYGHVVSLFLLASAFAYAASGFITDRFGTRRSMALFVGWWSLAEAATAFAASTFQLSFARFCLDLGEPGLWVAAPKAVGESFERPQRGLAIGIYTMGATVGAVVASCCYQLDALDQYKEARQKDTKYEVFSSADDLQRQVYQHFTGIVKSVAKPLQLGMWRNESSAVAVTTAQKTLETMVKDELKQAEAARRQTDEEKAEAARWKPSASIVSAVEGQEQVNKLVLKSHLQFALLEATLLSTSGAKLHDYAVDGAKVFSTGFSVPIVHASLLKSRTVARVTFNRIPSKEASGTPWSGSQTEFNLAAFSLFTLRPCSSATHYGSS